MVPEADMEHVVTLYDRREETIALKDTVDLQKSGLKVDRVFMARQLMDWAPNP